MKTVKFSNCETGEIETLKITSPEAIPAILYFIINNIWLKHSQIDFENIRNNLAILVEQARQKNYEPTINWATSMAHAIWAVENNINYRVEAFVILTIPMQELKELNYIINNDYLQSKAIEYAKTVPYELIKKETDFFFSTLTALFEKRFGVLFKQKPKLTFIWQEKLKYLLSCIGNCLANYDEEILASYERKILAYYEAVNVLNSETTLNFFEKGEVEFDKLCFSLAKINNFTLESLQSMSWIRFYELLFFTKESVKNGQHTLPK